MFSKHGFSLLEVIVALALISTVGLACFDLINSNLKILSKIKGHTISQQTIENALSFIDSVNPMEKPKGKIQAGDASIAWDAKLIEAEKDGVGLYGGVSLFKIGLYEVLITINIKNIEDITKLKLVKTGYHQVREIDNSL